MATLTNAPALSVGRRIKELRQSKGLTQKEFSASLGIVQGFLSGIERGKKGSSDTLLIALCNLYKIHGKWLTAGDGEMHRASNRGEETADVRRDREIPLFDRIAPEFPRTSKDDVRDYATLTGVKGDCYAIVAYGDFMAPTIRDGDLVIFGPEKKVDNGDIILIINHWGRLSCAVTGSKTAASFAPPTTPPTPASLPTRRRISSAPSRKYGGRSSCSITATLGDRRGDRVPGHHFMQKATKRSPFAFRRY